ncbi:MAG: cation diffusion facilitator family transporter [Candidatus Caenarcaniphilales bacterium]|nr:cation diffusion facilitator family transporter [Candidatus Caenarcaniphilales bacterium]
MQHQNAQNKLNEKGSGIVQKAALSSALAATFLTVMKIVVGIKTNSLGILAEAVHSAIDLVAALVTIWAVRLSATPPDEDHHFGHGKAENIAALFETFLLWLTCLWIAWEASNRLLGKTSIEIESSIWGFVIIIISIVVDITRSRELSRVAKEYNSQALAADALHFQTDAYSSMTVLIGLVCYGFGFKWADSIAALMVVIWTILVSLKLAKNSFDQLMDRAPEGVESQVLELLREIPEVKVISSIKIRQSGPATFVNITLGMDKTMSFELAHLITEKIEEKIEEKISNSIITIHAEPI